MLSFHFSYIKFSGLELERRDRMKKWQKEVIASYEQITAFDFIGKDEIYDDNSFWEKWDTNLQWFENVLFDIQNVINPYSCLRPE